MYVHTFGAFFGAVSTYFFQNKKALADDEKRCTGGYTSQLVAMIGTIFLWMFWPSFNGALAYAVSQQRVIVNTVTAISGSCIAAISMSRMFMDRLDMEVVLNATLAGGVSVGSASDLVVTAAISMAIGLIAGLVSAFGFLWLNGFLKRKISYHDTCGVLFLHGIPGALGGIIGAISAGTAENSLGDLTVLSRTFPAILADGSGRTPA